MVFHEYAIHLNTQWVKKYEWKASHTKLLKTHWLSGLSWVLHCHSWWLLFSRQSQCRLNSAKQCLLMSDNLFTFSH